MTDGGEAKYLTLFDRFSLTQKGLLVIYKLRLLRYFSCNIECSPWLSLLAYICDHSMVLEGSGFHTWLSNRIIQLAC